MYIPKVLAFTTLFILSIATVLAVPLSSSSKQDSITTVSVAPSMEPSQFPILDDQEESESTPTVSGELIPIVTDGPTLEPFQSPTIDGDDTNLLPNESSELDITVETSQFPLPNEPRDPFVTVDPTTTMEPSQSPVIEQEESELSPNTSEEPTITISPTKTMEPSQSPTIEEEEEEEEEESQPSPNTSEELIITTSPTPTSQLPQSPFVEDEDESEASPDESPEAEEVCVDAKYLSHVPNHQLVHKHHILSDVLCPIDSTLPCATSNHMIRVNDKRMSYGEFCEEHKCSKDKMEVNSVLSHLWNDEEHGDGVVLTMFDNRHPEMLQKSIHRIIATRRSLFKL